MILMDKQFGRYILLAITLVVTLSFWPCIASAQKPPNKAEYKKIFSDAISKSLSLQMGNNICLPPTYFGPSGSQSVEVNQRAIDLLTTAPTGQASQLKALEETGLMTSVPSERMINNKMESFRTYARTEKGNQYYSGGRFCYGRAELNKIVKWKGPAIFGEYKIAWVYYTAKMTNTADWVTMPAILAAFPTAKSTLQDDPEKVRQVWIDLTSEGWEVNEWSRILQ
jgi:hypothetical protein